MKFNIDKRAVITAGITLTLGGGAVYAQDNSAENSQGSAKGEQPNIILFLADDAGRYDFGCYGQTKIETPNVDQLARDGMLFNNHYSGAPVSAPSRCTLMTGKHTGHAFIRDNHEIQPEGQLAIPDSEVTVAERLKSVGYSTGAFGKWGLGAPGSEGHPNKQGFDYWYGYLCQREAHNYFPSHLWENSDRIDLDNDFTSGHGRLDAGADKNDPESYKKFSGKEFAGELIISKAEDFLRRNSGKNKFFMYYATPIPHLALQIPEDELNYYKGKFDEQPYTGNKGYLPQMYPRSAYAAMVTRIDTSLGRLIKILKETGQYENTLIIFTSDNGATFDVGGADTDFFKSNGDLRDYKGSVYEGGIAVPLVVSWPGKVEAGSKSNHVSAFWDFFPTACDAAGVEYGSDVDGLSYLPELTGNRDKQQKHEYLYWEHNRCKRAVRFGDWKGVKINGKLIEIYNLAEDPGETKNLVCSPKALKAKQRIKQIFKEAHVTSDWFKFWWE